MDATKLIEMTAAKHSLGRKDIQCLCELYAREQRTLQILHTRYKSDQRDSTWALMRDRCLATRKVVLDILEGKHKKPGR